MTNHSHGTVALAMHIDVNHILTVLFMLIAVIGVLGNLLVIVSVEFDARMRRSLTNRLIVRVASCDLMILVFNIPDIIQFVSSTHGDWVLNELACKLLRTILVLAQYASVLTMCALTVERFIGIVYPLRSKLLREKRHVILITVGVWLFSLACASPNLFYLRVVEDPLSFRRSCVLRYLPNSMLQNHRVYILHKSLESAIFYFLPLLLQIYCYSRIARQLYYVDERLQSSFHAAAQTPILRTADDEDDFADNDDSSSTRYTRADSICRSPGRRSQQTMPGSGTPVSPRVSYAMPHVKRRTTITYNALKSRRNVIKMLFIVVLIYFVSFSPQVLLFVLFETGLIRHVPRFIQTPYFIAFTMVLITISSASNPIVYAIFCSKFRQSFVKALRKLCCLCQKKLDYRSNPCAASLQQIQLANQRLSDRVHIGPRRPSAMNADY